MSGGKPGSSWKPKNTPFPRNTTLRSRATNQTISTGPSAVGGTVLLDDTDVPRTLGNCKQDQTMYSGTRFNETYNYPYWSTDSISSVVGISDAAFNAKTWAPAEAGNPAVVKMYQPNGWGSWAFEVSEISPLEADAEHEAGTRSIKVGLGRERATRDGALQATLRLHRTA
jgi:hypothetical protein